MPGKGKLYGGNGTHGYGPLGRQYRLPGQSADDEDFVLNWCPRQRVEIFEDFNFEASNYLSPFVGATAQTAGSPSSDLLANTADGIWRNILAATNEVESALLSFGDQLVIPATKRPIFQAMVTVSAVAANERLAIGLASAYNATLDSVASNLWFRVEGTAALAIEGDDGTTDTDDQPAISVTSLTAATKYLLTIDASDLSAVKFFVDRPGSSSMVGTVAVAALTANSLLQPLIVVQKASGTGTPKTDIDYVRASWDRSL